ncbi:MAG: hypothetical protein M3552_03060 [Planctomycetota bacterium]|nr:hypothetical protein [Planctomycetaceae bacterium]MDQ3329625.1 hypothetical protein [Planctomycetota bacterium]
MIALGQEQESRYHSRLADNTMVVGEPIRDWHDVNATPRVGNFPIFDPNRAVDWLVRDTAGGESTPSAYVEFVGGDRMPGEVLGYSSGDESPYRRLPPHLILRPTVAVRRPNTAFDMPVRLESEHVRRVVWQSTSGEPAPPETAVLRDGRRITFRALRWTAEAVSLLLESGVETVPYSALAEVHLAAGDVWDAFFDHAAAALPNGEGRLIQIQTDGGLVALISTQRLRPETHGDNRRTDHWYQAIQPAWCLDTLWVPFSSVTTWRLFSPERVPLTMLDPVVSRSDVVFSAARRPLTNAAVTGGPLGDGVVLFGWGVGLHAPCELTIPLPSGAVALRGGFALDPSVGSGGCAKARVNLTTGDKVQQVFESDMLIGASPARGLGRLQLAAVSAEAETSRELVLVADPVYEGRPSGADPFDIRDALNWLAPEIELDPKFAQAELRRRAVSRLPGLAGWEVDPDTSERATVSTRWDTRDWEEPRFRSFVAVDAGFVKLSRKLRVGSDDRYLAVFAHCPHDDFRPARIQARIDGTVLGEFPVPTEHGRREPDPLLFPVAAYAGKAVTVEVIQLPGAIGESKPAAVDWRGIDLVTHRPGLLALFEDSSEFVDQLTKGDGSATVETSEKQTGSASLKVMPSGRKAATIPGWDHIIAEEPDFGEYRFIRFAWKAGGAGPVAFAVGHDAQFGPGDGIVAMARRPRRRSNPSYERGVRNGYRYIAGPGGENDTELAPSIKLDGNVPKDWKVIQRDLFGDFGSFTFTGAGFVTRDGALGLDGLYLARSQDQFRFIEEDLAGLPAPLPGEGDVGLKTNDLRAYTPLVDAVAPSFSLTNQGGELQLLKEYRGRQNVLRTHPQGGEEKQSVRLTAAVELPPKAKSTIRLAVSQHGQNDNDQKDWDLQILADGRDVMSRRIDRAATNGGWLELEADLSEFADRPVRIELRHKANGWDSEIAYWHDVRIVSEPL